ncbi:MAG: bestrophin family ion channel [Cyclobacteriaceae bacterium]
MIDYNPKSWLGLIFDVYSRYVIKSLFPLLFFMVTFTALFCYLVLDYFKVELVGTGAFHSIIGIVLGLFLVLRTNTAYDRWWEGRKQWGKLVNDCRALAMKIRTIFPDDPETWQYFRDMIPNFCFATKEQLREGVLMEELDFDIEKDEKLVIKSDHRPNMITTLMYELVLKKHREGKINGQELYILDHEIKGLVDVIGACERIKTTPLPYSFSMYIKKFLFIFTMTLPMALVQAFGYYTIGVVFVAFYILVSIELISEEIEDPFGRDINDLPTDTLCVKIKKNVREILTHDD